MINKFKLLIVIFCSITFSTQAQELKCTLKVAAQKLQTTEPKVFQTLEKTLNEFMNNRKWTTDVFRPAEKIECSILINITEEKGGNRYAAQATIQSLRPVLNADYKSLMLNLVDGELVFDYAEFQTIDYTDNSSSNNSLSSFLAYYAYIIIGLDYDSFSPKGGAPWFAKAQNIVTLNQNAGETGWKSFEKTKNRYWLVENLTNSKYEQIHQSLYKYHRDGLDKMYDDPAKARVAIMESLTLINKINTDNPGSMIEQQFFSAKSEELTNIYSKATVAEKNTAVQMLSKLDPLNISRYQKIQKG